jgi:outer membrane protein assembly factor BamE (lipoprotein component of BamABCDE complex)
MKYLKLLVFGFSLFGITACNQIEKRGYAFELSDYEFLKEKINDKNDTLNFMGYPTFVSESNQGELWVYYSEDVKKLLFFKPKIMSRKIFTVAFKDKDIIEQIRNYDLEDQNQINFNEDLTEVASQKKSWWSQIFNNIGQVRAN